MGASGKSNWLGPPPGSRILIAGGCGGIGRALVAEGVAAGLQVVVLDLQRSIDLEPLAEGVRAIGFDGRDPDSIQDAVTQVQALGDSLDCFIYLTGVPILPKRTLRETGLKEWDELMSLNLRCAYLLSSAVLPMLSKGQNPSIVTVASSLAYQVMPGMGAYATSKGALVSLTKALAMENAPRIRANAVAPGAVDTAFLAGGTGRDVQSDRSWFDAIADRYVSMIPLGRVAEPADIVGPVYFLAGPGAGYVTGHVLHVNGGRLTP